jgi:hypothetical protein
MLSSLTLPKMLLDVLSNLQKIQPINFNYCRFHTFYLRIPEDFACFLPFGDSHIITAV